MELLSRCRIACVKMGAMCFLPKIALRKRWSCLSIYLPFLLAVLLLIGVRRSGAITRSNPPSYPEKGTVVAVRVDEHTDYVPVLPPDSKGRTHGGEPFVHRRQVYCVETDDGIYELEGGKDPIMAVGDAVEFRIAKRSAHVLAGKKEKKYRVISATPKPDSRSQLSTECLPVRNLGK
jgi:hypothetical protein